MKNRLRLIRISSALVLLSLALITYQCVSREDISPSDDREVRPKRAEGRLGGKLSRPGNQSKHSIDVPLLGSIGYTLKKSGVPEGDWLRPPDGKAYRKERIEKWAVPEVFYGDQGEILHAYFGADIKPTFSLKSMALQMIRDDDGLAILRAGYPDGVDVVEASQRLLKATRTYWMGGLESSFFPDSSLEISFTPVIVEVLSSGPESGVRGDHRWVGRQVPMVVVMETYGPGSGRRWLWTNSDLDKVAPKDQVGRSWLLYPYMLGGPDGPDQVVTGMDISGGAFLNEPLLEAWEALKAGDK